MTMPGDKDWLPRDQYLKSLPRKRSSAGAIFLNHKGEILLVKPNYKPDWLIPGGAVNQYESPRDACIREVREEIGLSITSPRFVGVLHAPRRDENDDVFHFYFYGGELSKEHIQKIQLQEEELEKFEFVDPAQAWKYTKKPFAVKLPALLTAIQENTSVFFDVADEALYDPTH